MKHKKIMVAGAVAAISIIGVYSYQSYSKYATAYGICYQSSGKTVSEVEKELRGSEGTQPLELIDINRAVFKIKDYGRCDLFLENERVKSFTADFSFPKKVWQYGFNLRG